MFREFTRGMRDKTQSRNTRAASYPQKGFKDAVIPSAENMKISNNIVYSTIRKSFDSPALLRTHMDINFEGVEKSDKYFGLKGVSSTGSAYYMDGLSPNYYGKTSVLSNMVAAFGEFNPAKDSLMIMLGIRISANRTAFTGYFTSIPIQWNAVLQGGTFSRQLLKKDSMNFFQFFSIDSNYSDTSQANRTIDFSSKYLVGNPTTTFNNFRALRFYGADFYGVVYYFEADNNTMRNARWILNQKRFSQYNTKVEGL